jgi:FkbM family methyltransferase
MSRYSRSRLAEVLDRASRRTAHLPGLGRLANGVRQLVERSWDPLITYRVGDFDLLIPLSHRLPAHQAAFPLYDRALGRLAALVHAKFPAASVVDIGANVGDTPALIRSASPAPILCIEGDPRFFAILERNAPRLGDGVLLENCLVGTTAGQVAGVIRSQGGTARVVDSSSGRLSFASLEEILARHPGFPPPALVKLDTDGFDCPIVESCAALWKRTTTPVLFFEYTPDYYPGWDPAGMWGRLEDAGYAEVVVLENTGVYEGTLQLADRVGLQDLHARYTGWGDRRYADLAIFSGRDHDLGARFREGELRATLATRRA